MTMTSDGTTKRDRARATGTSAPVPAPMAASHTTAERRDVRDRVARRSLQDFPVTGRAASRPTRNHQETRSRDGAVLPAGRSAMNLNGRPAADRDTALPPKERLLTRCRQRPRPALLTRIAVWVMESWDRLASADANPAMSPIASRRFRSRLHAEETSPGAARPASPWVGASRPHTPAEYFRPRRRNRTAHRTLRSPRAALGPLRRATRACSTSGTAELLLGRSSALPPVPQSPDRPMVVKSR